VLPCLSLCAVPLTPLQVDSLILHLKGKRIGHLQSYHHAGALICMWVAYRYQSQPVWGAYR
jgi:hypothetical protein